MNVDLQKAFVATNYEVIIDEPEVEAKFEHLVTITIIPIKLTNLEKETVTIIASVSICPKKTNRAF